ncbi:MAG: hypothetical protein ACM3U2_09780 [Deltaproteobacteria bacterium]
MNPPPDDMTTGANSLVLAAPSAAARWTTAIVFVGTLAALAAHRWSGPALDRPLDYDEWHTIEYYGWTGLNPAGDMQCIRRAADFEALARPNFRQLGLGAFRALGIWKEPNNQVPHSLLVNLATAFQRSPRAARVPAFLGAILFSVFVYILCGPILQWHWGAPLAGICAWSLPYVAEYGTSARGYTLMLALATLVIILAVGVSRRPASLILSAAMVLVASLSVFNVISLAADWVLPVYGALLLVPPAAAVSPFRKAVAVQGLAISGMCGVFAVDRLPALYLAAQKFGETIGSLAEFGDWARRAGAYLFPGAVWVSVAIAGALGVACLAGSRQYRFLATIALATFIVSGLHFAVARRCPYPRACGYFLVPIVIGVAYLAEQLVRRFSVKLQPAAGLAAFVGIMALGLAYPGRKATAALPPTEDLPQSGVYALLEEYDYATAKFLPTRWTTWQDRPAVEEVRYLAVAPPWRERGILAADDAAPAGGPPDLSPNALCVFPARAGEYTADSALPEARLVVATWYPDQNLLGMDPAPVTDLIERHSLLFVRRTARLQANYDYYLRPFAFEFPAEGAAPQVRLRDLLRQATDRFGGRIVVIHTVESGKAP